MRVVIDSTTPALINELHTYLAERLDAAIALWNAGAGKFFIRRQLGDCMRLVGAGQGAVYIDICVPYHGDLDDRSISLKYHKKGSTEVEAFKWTVENGELSIRDSDCRTLGRDEIATRVLRRFADDYGLDTSGLKL